MDWGQAPFSPPSLRDDGFTLLEVLVALAILSFAITALFAAFAQSLAQSQAETQLAFARSEAERILADAQITPDLTFGTTSGRASTSNDLSWSLQVSPFGSDDDRKSWQTPAALLSATVAWPGAGGKRSLKLSTLRLMPAEQRP